MAGELSVIESELKSHFGGRSRPVSPRRMYVSLFLSPFREHTFYLLGACCLACVGVKVCQLYNVSGERFFYKHEALILNQPRHPFSLKDIQEVKAMIKRDLDRENLTKRFAKGKLGGSQSRNFAKGGGLGGRFAGNACEAGA